MTADVGAVDRGVTDYVDNVQEVNELSSEEKQESRPQSQSKVLFQDKQDRLRTETLNNVKLRPNLSDREQFIEILTKYSNNPYKWDPLSYAVFKRDVFAVRVLLKNDADPNQLSRKGFINMPPQPWAVMFMELNDGKHSQKFAQVKDPRSSIYSETEREILKLLVGAGAQMGKINSYMDYEIVLSIIKMGWNKILSLFIKNLPKENLNFLLCSSISLTDGIFSPSKNLLDNIYKSCDILLSLGAEPDSRSGHSGEMPLISAIKGRNSSIVKLLLEHGANPNHRFIIYEGGAFALAARSGCSNHIISELLKYGAKP